MNIVTIRSLRSARRVVMAAATAAGLLGGPSSGLARDVCAWGEGGFEAAAIEEIRKCLAAGADPGARGKLFGRTPLHEAAYSGHVEAIGALLDDERTDLRARDRNGDTPVHEAAYSGHVEAIGALLDAGADPGARNKYGDTAFDLIPDDSPLVGTEVYWRLNDARWD